MMASDPLAKWRELQGATVWLVLNDGTTGAGISWRIYGFGAGNVWLESRPGRTRSKVPYNEFTDLLESRRITLVTQIADK